MARRVNSKQRSAAGHGSEARLLPGLEVDDRILTNIEILSLKEIPKSLIIVAPERGRGVRLDLSLFWLRSHDCRDVAAACSVEDEEISKELARVYRKRGINFHTGAKVEKIDKTKTGIAVTISVDGKQQKIEAEKILIAVGRNRARKTSALRKPKSSRSGFHPNRFLDADRRTGCLCRGRHCARFAATCPRRRHGGAGRCCQDCWQALQAN